MNGYFQLMTSESGTKLRLLPPTEGGIPVDINELINYLSIKNILYDLTSLNREVSSLTEEKIVTLDEEARFPEREMLIISISADKMSAVVRFYAPSNQGDVLTKEDILRELYSKKISYGIREHEIDEFVKNRKYCTNLLFAQGKKPVHGTDAVIEYRFNTDLRVRPTLNEDGSVDFFHLNNINGCKKGDVLAVLHKETSGECGETVCADKIKSRDVKKLSLKFGRNIALSEDKTVLTAQVNGHVSLVEGKVFVADVYSVENVDNATGNIDFEGSVLVNGNVRSGFAIRAKGNIEIKGVVEGAYLESGGNIIIARGMNGMSKGMLKAEGNVIAKFLENTSVLAGGFVETESIIHCNVMAKTEVNVVSKKGFITGGRVCATNAVHVKNLGSPMGSDTVIEVGVDPTQKARYLQLQKSLVEIKKELDMLLPTLQANKEKLARGVRIQPDQMVYFKQLVESAKLKQTQFESESKEYEELQTKIEGDSNAQVTVSGEVYPGTKIAISDVSLFINESLKYCKFVKKQGAVSMAAL